MLFDINEDFLVTTSSVCGLREVQVRPSGEGMTDYKVFIASNVSSLTLHSSYLAIGCEDGCVLLYDLMTKLTITSAVRSDEVENEDLLPFTSFCKLNTIKLIIAKYVTFPLISSSDDLVALSVDEERIQPMLLYQFTAPVLSLSISDAHIFASDKTGEAILSALETSGLAGLFKTNNATLFQCVKVTFPLHYGTPTIVTPLLTTEANRNAIIRLFGLQALKCSSILLIGSNQGDIIYLLEEGVRLF